MKIAKLFITREELHKAVQAYLKTPGLYVDVDSVRESYAARSEGEHYEVEAIEQGEPVPPPTPPPPTTSEAESEGPVAT